MLNTLTWLGWLFAAFTVISLTNNPLYLLLLLLIAALVFLMCRNDTPLARTYRLFFLTGLALWIGYVVFSVITVGGARGQTVLLVLPSLTLPAVLGGITLGGPLTAEDIVWGAVRGLRIWTLITIFGTFNALVDHYRLLRLAPRSLFHAGLAVTIAITFVPQTIRAIAEITESHRLRGHRLNKLRSFGPLIAALLAGSLEKSIQLAEALDARGYGRTRAEDTAFGRQQIGVLIGLFLCGAGLFGWLYYGSRAALPALALLLAGAGTLLLALRALGQLVPRTTYHRERWHRRDTIVLGIILSSWVGLILLRLINNAGLVYNPYPTVVLPVFDPLSGLLLLGLAAPALSGFARSEERPRHRQRVARQISEQAGKAEEPVMMPQESFLSKGKVT